MYYGCVGSSLLFGLSLVEVSRGCSSLQCKGFSLQWLLLLQHTGFSTVARGLSSCSSRAVEHRLSSCGSGAYCSSACGVTPDQGLHRRALRWQADSRRIRDCTGVRCVGRQIHAGSGTAGVQCDGRQIHARSGTAPVCSALAGRFTPDQGLHRCAVHWQADFLPLSHQGSPHVPTFIYFLNFSL